MKRSPLTGRRTPLKRGSQLARSSTSAKARARRRGKAIPTSVRRDVRARSMGWCEAQVNGVCDMAARHMHHVLRRSQGGEHDVNNLIHVCWPCHLWIHEHPAEAARHGWLFMRKGGAA